MGDNITGEPEKIMLDDLDFAPESPRRHPDPFDHGFHVFVWLNMFENNVATEKQVKESRKNAVRSDRTDTSSLPRPLK